MLPVVHVSIAQFFTSQWLESFVGVTIKSSLILVFVGLVCTLLRARSASTRHLIWTLGISAVVVLPLLLFGIPRWRVERIPNWIPAVTVRPIEERVAGEPDAETPVQSLPESTSEPADPKQAAPPAARGGDASAVAGQAEHKSEETQTISGGWIHRAAVIVFWVWLSGMFVTLILMSSGLMRLGWLVRRATAIDDPEWMRDAKMLAERVGFHGPVWLLRSDRLVTPMSWGFWHGVILLPNNYGEWNRDQRRDVLVHEIAHLKRHDCFTQGIANVACVIFWYNPLVWYAAGRMRAERERACDDQVIMAGSKPSTYADNLLDIAVSLASEHKSSYVSVAMARRSQLSGRLTAVLDPKTRRKVPGRNTILVTGIVLIAVLVPLGLLSPARTAVDNLTIGLEPSGLDLKPTGNGEMSPGVDFSVRRHAVASDIRDAIREVDQQFSEALKRRDADAMTALYAKDAQVYASMRPPCVGREQIRGHCQFLIEQNIGGINWDTDDLFRIGETVCEIGRFAVVSSNGTTIWQGYFITIWKQEDGVWKVHRDISTI
ncbi:MAG: DUF4440 domain-containing protein [Candidatus Latescibacterota bacterium]|nr:MAG: DUF4440 domain-containing protein [Candidatus Latescibacterota bacterium]